MSKIIFFVDDEKDVRELIEVNLKNYGFKAYGFENSLKMLEMLSKTKPDLIILDVMMPKMDGLETSRILKNNPETKDIPILLLTVKGSIDDIESGFKAGVNSYMIKPFSPSRLIEKVKELINKKTKNKI